MWGLSAFDDLRVVVLTFLLLSFTLVLPVSAAVVSDVNAKDAILGSNTKDYSPGDAQVTFEKIGAEGATWEGLKVERRSVWHKIVPGLKYTDHRVVNAGTYVLPWKPTSCYFRNPGQSLIRDHIYEELIFNARTLPQDYDFELARSNARERGNVIATENTLRGRARYDVGPGAVCQVFTQLVRMWQVQQARRCSSKFFFNTVKTCSDWTAGVRGDFYVINKSQYVQRCGENQVDKSWCRK